MGSEVTKLTSHDKMAMERAFKMFDVNSDNMIQYSEFEQNMKEQNIYVSPKMFELAFHTVDANGNRAISTHEFKTFWIAFMKATEGMDFYDIIGLSTDKNEDGRISKSEFARLQHACTKELATMTTDLPENCTVD